MAFSVAQASSRTALFRSLQIILEDFRIHRNAIGNLSGVYLLDPGIVNKSLAGEAVRGIEG